MLGQLFHGGIGLLVALLLYFVPAIVAGRRNHRNFKAILALDFFLGWTALGWVAALVWSLTDNVRPHDEAGDDAAPHQ